MTDEPDETVVQFEEAARKAAKDAKPKKRAWPVNKPASGMPANGAGLGAGWGGPPKGEGNHGPGPGRPPAGSPITVAKEERAEKLKEMLFDIATDVTQPAGIRIMAADKALDRIEGKAKADVNMTGSMTLESLITESFKQADTG